jgi:hypothetical protein
MGRVAAVGLIAAGAALGGLALAQPAAPAPAGAAASASAKSDLGSAAPVRVFADRDDDDDDGVPDGERADVPRAAAAADLRVLETAAGRELRAVEGDALRAIADGRAVASGALKKPLKPRSLAVQGKHAGSARLVFAGHAIDVAIVELRALDGRGEQVDLARSHASISRDLPSSLAAEPAPDPGDVDALRWVAIGPPAALPASAHVRSTRASGERLDEIDDVAFRAGPCPANVPPDVACRQTSLIRATSDAIDRSHPGSSARSLRAEVGGRIALMLEGRKAQAIRVGGPRQSELGPIGRLRGKLRLRLVKLAAGGSPPVGGDERGALAVARDEVRTASALWGQCGVHFGNASDLDVAVVDPPSPHLLAVGCDLGLPASGGEVTFRAAGKTVKVDTSAGQTPTEVANLLAAAVRKVGLKAIVSANARIAPGALRTVDVMVRKPDGGLVELSPVSERLSSDATLNVCLGEVDLADGLTHFTDFDAVSGTVEERSLIKAFDDGDPATIEVFVVPSFSRTGRIGESFIYADGSSVRNAVIIDRAGIRAGARSYALAHELGHILLDMPGHPDDYGVDQPSSLMDADAADSTIFGPRRLSVSDCVRAVRQSGPQAPVPLLENWPLYRAR